MEALRVRHVGFVVRDMERSLKFYCDILGLSVYKREVEEGEFIESLVGMKGVRLAWVKLSVPNGGLIELLQYKSHPDPDFLGALPSNRLASGHIALTVVNLDKLYEEIGRASCRE